MWLHVSLQLMPPCLTAKATMPAATRKERSVRQENRRDATGGTDTWAMSGASACGAGMRGSTVARAPAGPAKPGYDPPAPVQQPADGACRRSGLGVALACRAAH